MNPPDVLCQIRATVEALWTEVPAALVSRLVPRAGGATLSIHHGRGGAAAGDEALHLHQGAVDTERAERARRNSELENKDVFCTAIKKKKQVQILHTRYA